MMKYLEHKFILLFLLLQTVSVSAQELVAKRRIIGVRDSGFHRIQLGPPHKKHARQDLGNLRIMDARDQEVPFIIEQPGKNAQMLAIKDFRVKITNDSALKRTKVKVIFDYPAGFDGFYMHITAPPLYKRKARVYYPKYGWSPYEEEHGNTDINPETHKDLLLYSEERKFHSVGRIYSKWLLMDIYNHDDVPLKIDSIQFMQQASDLVVSLKPGVDYFLCYYGGDKAAPEYDLRFFSNRISSKNLPLARLEEPEEKATVAVTKAQTEKVQPENKPDNWFMWTCIGIGGLLVLFFANTLVREMRKG